MKISEKLKEAFKQLGRHIQKLREERSISIKELSNKTGIRKEYLKKIEDGKAYGVLLNKHLVKNAKAMRVKLSELFDYEQNT